MPKTRIMHLLFLLLLATGCAPALAWGSRGHRIIAALAEQQLTASTRVKIAPLLGTDDLATAATWADDMRGSPDNPAFWKDYANSWHFVNLPVGGTYQSNPRNSHGDALVALATFSAILQDQPVPQGPVQTGLQHYFGNADLHGSKVKRFALRFLVHVIADLHQPLHSGYASDHGGNDIKLDWRRKPTNLHALWDSALLDHDGLSEAGYVALLHKRIEHLPGADLRQLQSPASLDVRVWLHESSELLAHIHSRLPASHVLDSGYAAEFIPAVDEQLMKASVRTAAYLNNLLAPLPATTP